MPSFLVYPLTELLLPEEVFLACKLTLRQIKATAAKGIATLLLIRISAYISEFSLAR